MELLKESKDKQTVLFRVDSKEDYTLNDIFLFKGNHYIINNVTEDLILAKRL